MHTYFAEYFDTLEGLHADFEKQMAGLSAAGLNWAPGQECNSLAVLAAHLAGSQRYWLCEVLGGQESERVRSTEFETVGVEAETLLDRLKATRADSAAVVATLTLDDLAQRRFSPGHGREYTVAWVLHHALDHLAQHVGHAQLTRQLWNEREAAL